MKRRRSPCPTRKRCYPTAVAAYEAFISHTFSGAHPARAYRCDTCGHFHLTSRELRPPQLRKTGTDS